MQDFGLVSIIMPAWNCAEFIGESIESVLAQTYPNWELLIQDDCSTDGTSDAALKYAASDSRIKYMNNCECGSEGLLDGIDSYSNVNNGSGCGERLVNRGAALTRNAALRRAEGRWIAFLDADDLWLPDKLDHQLCFMADNGYKFSYTCYKEIDSSSAETGVIVSGPRHVSKCAMYAYCWPGCLTVMYEKNTVGLIQIADIKRNNDYAIWLEVIKHADCYFLNQMLALYRRGRVGSLSAQNYMTLIAWHYRLWRNVAGKNVVASVFWTVVNLICGAVKKLFFVRKCVNMSNETIRCSK